jgi:hypothetical protein
MRCGEKMEGVSFRMLSSPKSNRKNLGKLRDYTLALP